MFDDDELAALLARPHHEGQTDANAVPEARTTGITRGDMFTLGDHVLLCGDSTNPADVARVMGGQRADCVFTSPPYGVGIEYGGYVDTLDNLRAMLPTLAVQWCDVVVDGGFAVVNFGDILSGKDAAGSAVSGMVRHHTRHPPRRRARRPRCRHADRRGAENDCHSRASWDARSRTVSQAQAPPSSRPSSKDGGARPLS
jgi:hypothetical protein